MRKDIELEASLRKDVFAKLMTRSTPEAISKFALQLNIGVLLIVALSLQGLGVNAAISIFFIIFITLAATSLLSARLSTFTKPNILLLSISEFIEDLAILFVLIINHYTLEQVDPYLTIWLIMVALLVRTVVAIKLFLTLVISKVATLLALIACLSFLQYEDLQLASLFAPLIAAFAFILGVGYWLYSQRLQVMELYFIQNLLTKEVEEKSQSLNSEFQIREKIVRHVGHDLRQPINAIHYALHNVKGSEPELWDKTNLSRALVSVQTANHLVEEILQVSTYGNEDQLKINKESFSLNDVFDVIRYEYTEVAKTAKCELHVASNSLSITTDLQVLLRIIRNFLSNAIRHAPGSRILVGARRRIGFVEVQIMDTGPGISPEIFDQVCDEFVQGKGKEADVGFGLGLNIARQLSEVIGCEMKIRSKVDIGTCCSLKIPLISLT